MLHLSTSNQSFIDMHHQLKKEGVRYDEFLLLLDPDLEFVNPLQDKIPQSIMIKIIIECKLNPWYFFREIMRFSIPGGTDRYGLHLGNLAATWAMLNDISLLIMLPRQHGKTMSILAVYLYFMLFGTTNSNILFFNKEFVDSKLNVERVKTLYKILPSYLKKAANKKDKNNLTSFGFGDSSNFIRAVSPPTSSEKAAKKGRGETSNLMYLDEFSFISFIRDLYTSAAPAFSRASENAKKTGMPYSKVISTTPSYLDSPSGEFCYQVIKGSYKFDIKLLDMNINTVKSLIAGDYSGSNMLYIEYSYKELGRDDLWFKQQCADLQHDQTSIKMELLLEWLNASECGVFTEEQLDGMKPHIKKPVDTIMVGTHMFKLYDYFSNIRTKNIMISVDPATGASKDYTAITLINPRTKRILGTYKTKDTDLKRLQDLLYNLLNMFFINSFLVVESNSIGRGILDNLMYTNIENRIYYEYKKKVAQKKVSNKLVNIASKSQTVNKEKIYGVFTDDTNRTAMITILFDIVNNNPDLIIDSDIFDEIRTLERKKTGKIEHKTSGFHDDQLFSYLIGLRTLEYGTSINKFIRFEDEEGNDVRKLVQSNNLNLMTESKHNVNKSSLLDGLLKEYGGSDIASRFRNLN